MRLDERLVSVFVLLSHCVVHVNVFFFFSRIIWIFVFISLFTETLSFEGEGMLWISQKWTVEGEKGIFFDATYGVSYRTVSLCRDGVIRSSF